MSSVSAVPAAGWLTSLRVLFRWNLASIGPMLPLVIVVQALLGAGIIVGFGLIIPDIDPRTALFLSTGAPTVLLLTVGLVLVPQGVASARANGTFAFQRTLPVPRLAQLLADLLMWSIVALPGVAVGIVVAMLRFDLDLAIDWPLLVVTSLLVTVMATSVGYAIAVSLPPMVAQVVSQVLVFFVMLFSPITFPAERLPGWFQALHDFLPVEAGGNLMRAALASSEYDFMARDLVVLALWSVVGLGITLRALSRRK